MKRFWLPLLGLLLATCCPPDQQMNEAVSENYPDEATCRSKVDADNCGYADLYAEFHCNQYCAKKDGCKGSIKDKKKTTACTDRTLGLNPPKPGGFGTCAIVFTCHCEESKGS